MLLIAEIMLTIAAWRKGWKAWALVPMGALLALAFMIGVAMGASGSSTDDAFGVGLVLDLACVISLVILTVRAPKKVHIPRPAEPDTHPVTVETQDDVLPIHYPRAN